MNIYTAPSKSTGTARQILLFCFTLKIFGFETKIRTSRQLDVLNDLERENFGGRTHIFEGFFVLFFIEITEIGATDDNDIAFSQYITVFSIL